MKNCCKCKVVKSLDEFHKCKKYKDGLQLYCKSCKKESAKKWYDGHSGKHKELVRKRELIRRERLNKFICDYLKSHPCMDCGETDIVVLEFDHINDDKFKDVSILITSGFSEDVISKEINKCEVRCCNCHRRRHAKERNFYRIDYI